MKLLAIQETFNINSSDLIFITNPLFIFKWSDKSVYTQFYPISPNDIIEYPYSTYVVQEVELLDSVLIEDYVSIYTNAKLIFLLNEGSIYHPNLKNGYKSIFFWTEIFAENS